MGFFNAQQKLPFHLMRHRAGNASGRRRNMQLYVVAVSFCIQPERFPDLEGRVHSQPCHVVLHLTLTLFLDGVGAINPTDARGPAGVQLIPQLRKKINHEEMPVDYLESESGHQPFFQTFISQGGPFYPLFVLKLWTSLYFLLYLLISAIPFCKGAACSAK